MTKYIVEFSKHGETTFLALPKVIRNRIEKKIRFFLVSGNPLSYAEKMQGFENWFRFRIGDYRVLFSLKNQKLVMILLILKVGHRKDVYK